MSKIAVQSRASRFPQRREQRRADCAARNALAAEQGPHERLAVLDQRLGVGKGATKERVRLHARIAQGEQNMMKAAAVVLFEGPAEPGEAPKKLKAKDRRAKDKKLTVRQ